MNKNSYHNIKNIWIKNRVDKQDDLMKSNNTNDKTVHDGFAKGTLSSKFKVNNKDTRTF